MPAYLMVLIAINIFLFNNDVGITPGTKWNYKALELNPVNFFRITLEYSDKVTNGDSILFIFKYEQHCMNGTWDEPVVIDHLMRASTDSVIFVKTADGSTRRLIKRYTTLNSYKANASCFDTQSVVYTSRERRMVSLQYIDSEDSCTSEFLESIGIIGGYYRRIFEIPCDNPEGCIIHNENRYELYETNGIPFSLNGTGAIVGKHPGHTPKESVGHVVYPAIDLAGRVCSKKHVPIPVVNIYRKGVDLPIHINGCHFGD